MILANVAAATALEGKGGIAMYRVHDEPPTEKRDALSDFLASIGGSLPKGNRLTPGGLARILERYKDTEESILVNEMMLRSQSRAAYSPDNLGHFGLALPRYAHFTSPIRRYADLLVHRALISAYQLGDDGLPPEQARELAETGEHLGVTEQRAMQAERSTNERYVAAYLAGHTGAILEARVSGVTHFGLFVRLVATGADGLIPMMALGQDFFVHDEKAQMLVGQRTGLSYRLGQALMVRLDGADGLTGRLQLAVVGPDGEALSDNRGGNRRGGGGHSWGGRSSDSRGNGRPAGRGNTGGPRRSGPGGHDSGKPGYKGKSKGKPAGKPPGKSVGKPGGKPKGKPGERPKTR